MATGRVDRVVAINEGVRAGRGIAEPTDVVVRAARKLMLVRDPDRAVVDVPRRALEVVPADLAVMAEVTPDGELRVVSRFGTPPLAEQWGAWSDGIAASVAHGEAALLGRDGALLAPDAEQATVLVAPVWDRRRPTALVVARSRARRFLRGEALADLVFFALTAGAILRRTDTTAEVQTVESRLALLCGVSGRASLFLDERGRVSWLDPTALALLGVEPSEVIGKGLGEVDALVPLAARVVARGGDPRNGVALRGGRVRVETRALPDGTRWVGLEAMSPRHASPEHRVLVEPDDLIAEDPAMVECTRAVRYAARSAVPVLVIGEPGAGRSSVAEALHAGSSRADGPFRVVRCAGATSEALLEELFGDDGVTGGALREAAGGTVVLDEVHELPADVQAALARALADGCLRGPGSIGGDAADARVVAIAAPSIETAVEHGTFRRDLYHRLRVACLRVPALRDRIADIAPLAALFVRETCEELDRGPVRLARGLDVVLQAYPWPGNVRELHSVIRGVVSLLPPEVDWIDELPILTGARPSGRGHPAPLIRLDDLERRAIATALAYYDGNRTRAAKALGVRSDDLVARIKRYGLE